ncbi:MAG TPA: RNA polymerase sigma-54 factor [Bacteroidetes bacterium]|nr:RNA polymerase sigma-54 factor [Bacteroidota bacterium]HRR08984.1 RNA polymerase factor sigma-54 [Rhodothermales bacterium]
MTRVRLTQQQKLQQKLSPQQIQYIKLLQLPTLALEQRVKQEIEINPLLEEGLNDEEPRNEENEERNEENEGEGESVTDDFDWDEYLNPADELYGYKANVEGSSEEDYGEMPAQYFASLSEHLLEQIGHQDFDRKEYLIAEQIIGSIDEDGYLRRSLEAISDDVMFNSGLMPTEEEVEAVLYKVQRFDPVGIAARDLRECLLVQLYVMPNDEPGLEAAIQMLRKCYQQFAMKHFDIIMRRLDIDESELKDAYDLIKRLNPKPGEGLFRPSENYITPDFMVEYTDGEIVISLNGKNLPQLRISRGYRQMWETLASRKKTGGYKDKKRTEDNETRKFLKSKIESARWFINSLNQRRQTMLKVMQAIVLLQEDFFKFGEGHLKPMILKDIAQQIEMDISTVSRVVSNKYVQTEWGVYELKYFFSEGLATESGEEVSNKEIRSLIQHIIEAENKAKPLSDQRLVELLAKKGYHIARRTVTKYREHMNIPVARLRKQIVL